MLTKALCTLFLTSALTSTLTSVAQAQQAPVTPQYSQTNLVSNVPGVASTTDPNLVDAWGLSRATNGAWWVSDNGTGLSTLYDGTGKTESLVVKVPTGDPNLSATGTPTGTIYNGFPDFNLAPGKPSIFLFATEDGTISGWNPTVAPTTAIITVNEHSASVFKGLTWAQARTGLSRGDEQNEAAAATANYLYAADFRKARIAVYDTTFQHAPVLEERIALSLIPFGFEGYAPFNVQNIGGTLYITLAKQDKAKHDEIDGPGLGLVLSMTPEGKLLQIFQGGSFLNAPWGLAMAPGDFGAYSHDLLVGNFGSGTIVAYNPTTGRYLGELKDKNNAALAIDGLWGLSFGSAGASGSADTLYFGAGPNGERGGLFGSITALTNPQGNDQ